MIMEIAEGLSVLLPNAEQGPSFENFKDFVAFMKSRPTEEIISVMDTKYQIRNMLEFHANREAALRLMPEFDSLPKTDPEELRQQIGFINRHLDVMRRELLKRGHRVRQVRYANGDWEMKDELLPHAFCKAA